MKKKTTKETSLITDTFLEISFIRIAKHEGKLFDMIGKTSYLIDFTLSR